MLLSATFFCAITINHFILAANNQYMRSAPVLLLSIIFSFCFLNVFAQQDTVMYQRDSAVESGYDPLVLYFQQGEKAKDLKKVILVTKNRKTISLAAFLKDPDKMYADYVFDDLDNDGKKELLVSNFTGGAHCCDEIYIFKNVGPNKYQHAAKMYGGHTLITDQKKFVFTFYEQFGYFFTCYACGYTDTTDEAPIDIRTITLGYKSGRLIPEPGDAELKSIINDNLGKLGEQTYQPLENDGDFDEGLRKEFAMNLVVYYFSFGKNLTATQQLFYKHYKFPDAKKVWTEFVKELQYMKKDNDF